MPEIAVETPWCLALSSSIHYGGRETPRIPSRDGCVTSRAASSLDEGVWRVGGMTRVEWLLRTNVPPGGGAAEPRRLIPPSHDLRAFSSHRSS
jgi:hypothetical protein